MYNDYTTEIKTRTTVLRMVVLRLRILLRESPLNEDD